MLSYSYAPDLIALHTAIDENCCTHISHDFSVLGYMPIYITCNAILCNCSHIVIILYAFSIGGLGDDVR